MEGDVHMWTRVFVQASIEVGIKVYRGVHRRGLRGLCLVYIIYLYKNVLGSHSPCVIKIKRGGKEVCI